MSPNACAYGEEDLLPIALGQPASDELHVHVSDCPKCQQGLQLLQREASTLRRAVRDADSTDTFSPIKTAPPDDRPPATIGKYLIVGKLGQGTQATAYRALHPVLHKELVIKYARKPLDASREERDALIREGRILADLDHPNLAKVLDLDLHDNRPFLVMEYHRGLNLEQCVAQRRLPPREAAALIAPLARALAAAHRRGIVHQDVKPANILIDETGKPFVLDFGLARLRDAWSTAADQPDGGTVAYMAPEQARGDAVKIGPASDVFSLGAVFYFLLTGNPPFRAGDWYATMKQAGRCEFDVGALRGKGIPPSLAAICLRAMAAEPDQRYRQAEDMASDLERYLRRPRKLLVLAAAASLLLAAVALWHFWPTASLSVEQAQAPVQQLLITGIGRTEKGEPQRHPISATKDLATHAPLKHGDIVSFGFEVSHGFQSAFFFVNAAGEVRELEPLQVHTVGATDRVRFPAKDDWQLDDPPGPVLFLACASARVKPSLEEVRRLVQEDGNKPIPLPVPEEKRYLFSFNRAEPLEESRVVKVTAYSQLRDRLERLRKGAADKFDDVWGVALPLR